MIISWIAIIPLTVAWDQPIHHQTVVFRFAVFAAVGYFHSVLTAVHYWVCWSAVAELLALWCLSICCSYKLYFERISGDTAEYEEIVGIFRQLPETYRAVLEMKVFIGYSDKEVAAHLGISETAVSTRANRGRALLKKMMEREGMYP